MLVGFIRFRWVPSGAPWVSYSSIALVGFIRVRAEGHWVHSGSLERTLEVMGFIRVRWVHSGTPLGSSGSLGLVGYIRTHPDGFMVH